MTRRFRDISALSGVLLGLWLTGTHPALARDAIDRQTCVDATRIAATILHDPSFQPARGFPLVLSQVSSGAPPELPLPRGGTGPTTESNPFWSDGWRGERASPELIHAWLTNGQTSIVQCWATDRVGAPVPILSAKEEARFARKPLTLHKTILHMSLPTFDASHTHALVYLATFCGGLCGSETVVTLRKNGDDWIITGDKLVGIS